jgi:hypothetical protein
VGWGGVGMRRTGRMNRVRIKIKIKIKEGVGMESQYRPLYLVSFSRSPFLHEKVEAQADLDDYPTHFPALLLSHRPTISPLCSWQTIETRRTESQGPTSL